MFLRCFSASFSWREDLPSIMVKKIPKNYYIFSGLILLFVTVGYIGFKTTFKSEGRAILKTIVNNQYFKKNIESIVPPEKSTSYYEPNILAKSAILVRQTDKYPLYQKSQDESTPIASITKVMTAIVSLENYNLTDVVEVNQESTEVIPSKIFLKTGEKITVDSLIDGSLIASGNDAANALAAAKWTKEEFVELMNKKAEELGMRGTKFYDPAGLDDNGRSTARDIAIMFSYGLNFDKFKQAISTKEKNISSVDGLEVHPLKNSNRLLTGEISFDGEVIGGKTGVTDLAGHTLVCAVKRGETTVVGVILNTYSDSKSASAEEMKKMLDWGFLSYVL